TCATYCPVVMFTPSYNNSFFILFFSFHPHVPHRALPSFPTRRSSDLGPHRVRLDVADARLAHTEHVLDPGGDRGELVVRPFEDRSEEHTSELQSRVDLVCRLLLEKKKK